MILGTITGKITTSEFQFVITGFAQKLDFVQVYHEDYGYVLCQILEIIRDPNQTIGQCTIIGYKSESGTIGLPRVPFANASEVLRAEDEFISQIIKLDSKEMGALIGKLEGRNIPVYLNLQNLLTKHISVLAKSGAGKSYCVGVLLEEILRKKVPLLIIDPHGEYETLREKGEENEILQSYDLKPTSFVQQIQVYGDSSQIQDAKPLHIPESLTAQEILQILPSKLSTTQEGLLYSALKQLDTVTIDTLQAALESEESPAKWHVIKLLDHLKEYNIFSSSPIPYNEMIRGGMCSILHLKGIPPHVQQILVYKILTDLFELRKKERIPPFFCIVEEAHNFCPERSFQSAVCSNILRTIASEGRKFGLGLCVISQRPARVDKSILSQVSTQIVLKVTNPNDLKTLTNTIEGLTYNCEKEIQNLAIGHALVTGVVDVPLFVNVRPRLTKHGGTTVNILDSKKHDAKFFEKLEEFNQEELVPIIQSDLSKKDFHIMASKDQSVKTALIPCVLFLCESKNESFTLLIERINGFVITDISEFSYAKLPDFSKLTKQDLQVLQKAYELQKFSIEHFFKKTGLAFSAKDSIQKLLKIGYLQEQSGLFSISSIYIFSNLAKYALYKKIQYEKIGFDKKLEPRFDFDTLKDKLSKFATISDFRECYILKHEIIQNTHK